MTELSAFLEKKKKEEKKMGTISIKCTEEEIKNSADLGRLISKAISEKKKEKPLLIVENDEELHDMNQERISRIEEFEQRAKKMEEEYDKVRDDFWKRFEQKLVEKGIVEGNKKHVLAIKKGILYIEE